MRFSSSNESFYVYAARAARGFGDGFAVIILPAYLTEIGFDPFRVGIIATAALLGTALTTLAAGFIGRHYQLRNPSSDHVFRDAGDRSRYSQF